MTNIKKYFTAVLIAACCIVWAACTQTKLPCLTPTIAGLNIECVHLTIDTSLLTADTALPAAIFIAITDSGKKEVIDSLYNSLFTITLSPKDTICRWMVATDTLRSSLFDTLTFTYQRNLTFLSNACGFTYFYTLDSVHTSHFNIDSAVISNASVTNDVNTEHVKLYIHPDY